MDAPLLARGPWVLVPSVQIFSFVFYRKVITRGGWTLAVRSLICFGVTGSSEVSGVHISASFRWIKDTAKGSPLASLSMTNLL